tara:strand:+ start:1135 stop:1596 length:462 start_codon:yes stop_codon:yes gene_type:complete
MIKREEVINIQSEWGRGIVSIGNAFKNGKDYKNMTIKFIKDFYAYDSEEVLFKPTLASDIQFRLTSEAALSYFIGGDANFIEDSGFAIKGWSYVRWQNAGIKIIGNIAVCMGNYFFTFKDKEDLKVEYTMVFKKADGKLKIILHDSHLPFQNK